MEDDLDADAAARRRRAARATGQAARRRFMLPPMLVLPLTLSLSLSLSLLQLRLGGSDPMVRVFCFSVCGNFFLCSFLWRPVGDSLTGSEEREKMLLGSKHTTLE